MRRGLATSGSSTSRPGSPARTRRKLFADAGADVVKVEPPGGRPAAPLVGVRHRSRRHRRPAVPVPEHVEAFGRRPRRTIAEVRALARGCRSRRREQRSRPGRVDVAALHERDPRSSSCRSRPAASPARGRPTVAPSSSLQAECGSIGGRGTARQARRCRPADGSRSGPPASYAGPPRAGRRPPRARDRPGCARRRLAARGDAHRDEPVRAISTRASAGDRRSRGPARWIELPSIEPTADGWVGFNTNAMQMFHDFLVLIERPDWLEDAEMLTFVAAR